MSEGEANTEPESETPHEGINNKALSSAIKDLFFHAENNRLHAIIVIADPITGDFSGSTNGNPITIPGMLDAGSQALMYLSDDSDMEFVEEE
jgi:hypothetical protein